ncbi:MAG: alpha-galactosidase [Sphingomonadales bacterium]
MSDTRTAFHRLESGNATALIDLGGDGPALLYFGPRLTAATTPAMVKALAARASVPNAPAGEAPVRLAPLAGDGWTGQPGIAGHRDGRGWGLFAALQTAAPMGPDGLAIRLVDAGNGLAILHRLRLDPDSDVLVAWTEVTNTGDDPFELTQCAALTLPLPDHLTHIRGFEGRWAGEFQTHLLQRHVGAYVRENRRGRTSHDAFPGLVLESADCGENHGQALALHLGWSGNHRTIVETLADGRGYVQMGELFLPGEIILAPGARYRSPDLFIAASGRGRNGISHGFHRHVRQRLLQPALRAQPRPIHFNSWEAVYFNHDIDSLKSLADEAAAIGAERFVLDDGWFRHRRHDRAGLGDWYVDEGVYPQGLEPLIAHVQARGLEFGLWVEPEMVNPDSDLYRAHPGWVLSTPPAPNILFRHQLTLDLTRPDVTAYLYERLDALLGAYPIGYLKWDMNRDSLHPGDATGRAAMHRQNQALYNLIDRLRAAHPKVEIESCASGGGRADFGILARTDRIWTSDSNDALDRLSIQKGFSLFFPAEVMGAHVGPADCHITRRRLPMETRAAVALFGHMGLEVDLRQESDADKAVLRAAIALHKRHRALIHSGRLVRFDTPDHLDAFAIVANDASEALASCAMPASYRHLLPGGLRFAGLDPDRLYDVSQVWPIGMNNMALRATGEALMTVGLTLPCLMPQSVTLYHLRAAD